MSDFNRGYARTVPADRADMSVDAGLRSFMLGVYNKVALGLVLSAALAYATSQVEPVRDMLYRVSPDGRLMGMTALGMIVAFAPLVVLLFSMFTMRKASPKSASILYWVVVSLIGASLGVLGLVYTGASLFSTFLITATAFGALSLFGYTTKKNLTGFGSFLMIGLVGLLLAMLVNVFIQNSVMGFIISAVGVFIFAGLIAYDTQRLKMQYYELAGDSTAMGVATSYAALNLYLDFINLFRFLLYFLGVRSDD